MNIIEIIESRETALTVDELAAFLNNSPKTLYKAIHAGKLPAYKVLGSIRLDPVETAKWLRECSISPRKKPRKKRPSRR